MLGTHTDQLPAGSVRRNELPVADRPTQSVPIDGKSVGLQPSPRHREHIPDAATERIRSGIGNIHVERYKLIEAAAVRFCSC